MLRAAAVWYKWLCSVPCSKTIFPIKLSVLFWHNCVIFLIPSSISVASLAPWIGDLIRALTARLFAMLYFAWISWKSANEVFLSPYSTCAYMAPTIKFLLIDGEIPIPRSIKGTSWMFVFWALRSWFSKCFSCPKLLSIIFPKYL